MEKKIISPTLALIVLLLTIWISFSKLLVLNFVIIGLTILYFTFPLHVFSCVNEQLIG